MRKTFLLFFLFILTFSSLFAGTLFLSDAKKTVTPLSSFQPTDTPIPTPIPTNTPTPTLTPTPTEIPTPTPTPIVMGPTELEALFSQYSNKYSIDKNILIKIADCESHFNTNAASPHGYVGLFQFSENLWITTRNRMGENNDPSLRTNPEESIKTASLLISEGRQSVWPQCSK